jgi:hypothetical protein
MGQVKKWMSLDAFEDGARASGWQRVNENEYWATKDGRLLLISEMDYEHLEMIVNYFSRDGMVVDPRRQGAFENVMLTYLRKKAEIEEMIERTQHDIL